MTDKKPEKVVDIAAVRTEAMQAFEKLQEAKCQSKLVTALDMTHACARSKLSLRPDIIEDLIKFSDTYISILHNAVQALGGTGIEIIASFPEGKVKIDKFWR